MDIRFFTYSINGLLMVGLGIGLGVFLTRKFNLGWRLWCIGAATFILSQIGHIPFNYGVTWLSQKGIIPVPPQNTLLYVNAIFLGISSGLWEETARYCMYRWWVKDARSWYQAVLAGTGHGGVEAIILGALTLLAFVQMIAYRNADLSTLVPADQLVVAQKQIQAYWSAPWYATILGAAERIFALCLHITNSALVLQVFTRKQSRWLWAAIGWHAIFNTVAIIANANWGPYITEGILAIVAILSLAILFSLRQEQELENLEPSIALLPQLKIEQVDGAAENLDNSRFTS